MGRSRVGALVAGSLLVTAGLGCGSQGQASEKPGGIRRIAKTGVTPVTLASGQDPFRVAVDDANVYWTNWNEGTVMKVSKHGGTPVVLARGQRTPGDIAVDATSVYWATDDAIMKLTPK